LTDGLDGLLTEKAVLINGAGTVGIRAADILLSLGIPVYFGKYGAEAGEIKTTELHALIQRYRGTPVGDRIKVFAAPGKGRRIEDRIHDLQQLVGRCDGPILDSMDATEVALAIDCTDGMEMRNHMDLYGPKGLPFAVNGGCKEKELIGHRFFVGAPHSSVAGREEEYAAQNAMIVSCNSTCVSTAIGLFAETIGGAENLGDLVSSLHIFYLRRVEDPHRPIRKGKGLGTSKIEDKPSHIAELESLYPPLRGRITTAVKILPTQYFHEVRMTFDLAGAAANLMDKLRLAFLTYPRCILAEGDAIDQNKALNAIAWAYIDDGDIPLPIYVLHQRNQHTVSISALTPQRGITAPGTTDYALLRLLPDRFKVWQDAAAYVNEHARWRGHRLSDIKGGVQDNLGEKYREYVGERGERQFQIYRSDAIVP